MLLIVTMGSLAVTGTSIFDKMKGSPLNDTEFAVGIAVTVGFGCGAVALLGQRLDRNRRTDREAAVCEAPVQAAGHVELVVHTASRIDDV
jgi:hypothetical protein